MPVWIRAASRAGTNKSTRASRGKATAAFGRSCTGAPAAAIRGDSNPAVRALYDRLRAKGKHQKTAEVACMRKLLAIVYGCWANDRWFDPTFEERLKARQQNRAQKNGFEARVQAENERDDEGRRLSNSDTDIEAPVSRQ